MTKISLYGDRTPEEAASHVRPRRANLTESRRLTGTQEQIVTGARKLFEKNGVNVTTVSAIAREANVTRELIYYHFKNKNGVIEAVIDDFVEDLVESAIVWNEARILGDTLGSLRECIRTFRYALYDTAGRPRPMIKVLEELGIRDAFGVRATRETVECFNDHIIMQYAVCHKIEVELVYEMFCVMLYGLVGLVKVKPHISDEDLMKVVQQTLQIKVR